MDQNDVRIIDYNKLMEQRMEGQRSMSSMQPEWNQTYENGGIPTETDDTLQEGDMGALFSEGLQTAGVIKSEPVYEGPTPEEIAAQAEAEADEVIAQAQAEAERIKADAAEQGRRQGYEEGRRQGMTELEAKKAELLEARRAEEDNYREQLEQLEPLLVETITDVYRHIFQVDMSEYSKVVLYLLETTLRNVEGSRDFLVHVSKNDYPLVSEHKKQLLDAIAISSVTFEVIEDVTLRAGECLIETEGGIFDCGIGTQLNELERELKLLSYRK